MITRRALLAGSALAALGSKALAAPQPSSSPEMIDFLFVQTSKSLTFDASNRKLSLEGVSPVTLFFSDRPERIAGNMETSIFVPFWAKGKDSFLAVPPNADVSILEGDKLRQIVVELQDPTLEAGTLAYTVKVIKGEMPQHGSEISVFIDVVGMPATPVSVAGVGRRSYRRAVIYH